MQGQEFRRAWREISVGPRRQTSSGHEKTATGCGTSEEEDDRGLRGRRGNVGAGSPPDATEKGPARPEAGAPDAGTPPAGAGWDTGPAEAETGAPPESREKRPQGPGWGSLAARAPPAEAREIEGPAGQRERPRGPGEGLQSAGTPPAEARGTEEPAGPRGSTEAQLPEDAGEPLLSSTMGGRVLKGCRGMSSHGELTVAQVSESD